MKKNRFLKLGLVAAVCAIITLPLSSCKDDDATPTTPKKETPVNNNDDKDDKGKGHDDGGDTPTDQTPATIADNVTAMSIAQYMYPGWNLGNTMEAVGEGLNAETAWQGTLTSADVAKFVKAQGFRSVRIPCSWHMHMSDPKTCTIDKDWMKRVTDVVDYFVNEGLYVILNDHWDNGWLEILGYSSNYDSYSPVDESTIKAKSDTLQKIWTQIANNFKNYDEHLLFAGQNEPFVNSLFRKALDDRDVTLAPILNKYNQAFVKAVRATGGNNAKRILVVQAPSTSFSGALLFNFAMPADTRQNGLMMEVHHYQPWGFTSDESGMTFLYWGRDNYSEDYYPDWFADEDYLYYELLELRRQYSDKGIPVVIGEYGAMWRDLSDRPDADQAMHDASIKAFHKAVNQLGPDNGMIPMVWGRNACDRRGDAGEFTVLDRANLKVFSNPAMEGIKEGAAAAIWMK